jgi:catechol 2,3-dioxygenase-like lactoylglutathione lyase family enzyme
LFGFCHVIIDVPPRLADQTADFWSAALGWPVGDPWPEHPEFRSLVPAVGDAYVHLQTGDHGPRIHLDAAVQDVEVETTRLLALGAGSAQPGEAASSTVPWQNLLSPGGFPLCLIPTSSAVVPPPLETSDGNRLRLVQVCVDMPRSRADQEIAFWRTATGWHWVPSGTEAFAGKLHHRGASPVQLLLQRLGETDPARTTRAHLDLGADDVESAVRLLVNLGADRGPTGDGWVVLTDPVGMTFCVTGNAPD